MGSLPTYNRPARFRRAFVALALVSILAPTSASQADVMTWMDHAPKRLTTSLRTLVLRATAALEPSRIPRRPRQRSAEAIFVATQQGPFDDTISDAARHWKLDPFLLKGLLANESKLEPVRYGKRRYARRKGSLVVVAGGAMGIAQFTGSGIRAVNALRRRRQRAGAKVLFFDAHLAMIPSRAISAAAELLAHLVRTYGRDGGITAYNSGVVGGLAVYRYGFYRARSEGRLSRVGIYEIQGYRFLLNVLRKANWYRAQAGLPPLEAPDAKRPASRRYVNARNKTPLG